LFLSTPVSSFLSRYGDHLALLSFPTRRSSDLLLALYLLEISKENSVMILLGLGVLRVTASLAFIFLILWTGVGNILWFVVDFFMIYLLYLLFDIYTFITNLRPHSE